MKSKIINNGIALGGAPSNPVTGQTPTGASLAGAGLGGGANHKELPNIQTRSLVGGQIPTGINNTAPGLPNGNGTSPAASSNYAGLSAYL